MTNVQIFDKVKKVLESCKTMEQYDVGINFAYVAMRQLPEEWQTEVYYLVSKTRDRRKQLRIDEVMSEYKQED